MHPVRGSGLRRRAVAPSLCGLVIALVGCSEPPTVADASADTAATDVTMAPADTTTPPADVAPPPADTTTPPDVAAPPDATAPPDVTAPPDATQPADVTAPPDVVPPSDAGPRRPAWSRRYGDASDQDCFALALDSAGNVLLSTFIGGTVDFGNGPLSGFDRIAIAKLDPGGAAIWSHIYPNGGHHYATGIGVSSSGAIAIAGSFEGTLNFGGASLVSAGADDIFAAGISADGAASWRHAYGDAQAQQRGLDLATDAAGSSVFVGHLTGAANFGGGALVGNNVDAFAVKVDADGNHVWSRVWGDPSLQFATGVAIAGDGSVLVAGRMDGMVDFGGGRVGTGNGLFLTKLTAAGGFVFARAFAATGTQVKRSRVGADAAGNIYVAGSFSGSLDVGGGAVASRGSFDVYVAKFDPSGRLLWHREYGDAVNQEVTDLAVDAAGNVALIGVFDGAVDFGGGALTSMGGDTFVGGDMFVATLSTDGAHRFSARYGDAQPQRGQTIAIDAAGDLVVAGTFRGTLDLGSGPMTSAGGTDIFAGRIRLP